MRRLLNQTANAAVKVKGSIFEIVYRRSVPRLGHNQAIGAIAHRQCRLIWLILHQGVRYEERGPAVTKRSKQRRTARMIRQLRSLGYRIELPDPKNASPAQAQGFSTLGLRRFISTTASISSFFGPFGPGRRPRLGENNMRYFRLLSTLWRCSSVEGFR